VVRGLGLDFPSFEEGALRPINKMSRYLKQGAAGEVRILLQQGFDLPGSAEFKVALYLVDRRCLPSSKEGKSKPNHPSQPNPLTSLTP